MTQNSLTSIRSRWHTVILLTLLLGMTLPARAIDLKVGDDTTFIKFGLLLQGWGSFIDHAAPNKDSLDTDFYLRRMRILLSGQLNEKINFFIETDNPNLGMKGDFSSRTFIQDAWVEFNLLAGLQIDAGMLLVPFSHNGMQGATSLHSLDYHTNLIRYPTGSHLVWRDYGVMLRGLLFDQLLEYRLAILNGVHGSDKDPRNPNDWPRLTARLVLNLMEAEGIPGVAGFFYKGVNLKKGEDEVISPKKVVSVGFSADWQKDLNVALNQSGGLMERKDYFALEGDVFVDLPLDSKGLLGLAGQINFFYYNHGDRVPYIDENHSPGSFYGTDDKKFTAEYTGYGFLSELGVRYDAYEVIFSTDWYNATETFGGDEGDLLSIYGGLNWWWYAHSTSLKLQVGRMKKSGGDWELFGIIQAQLLL